jgi:transposase-like protein
LVETPEAKIMRKLWKVPYKKIVLEYAEVCGSDVKSYREFGVSRSTFYQWRKAFREHGAENFLPPLQVPETKPDGTSR